MEKEIRKAENASRSHDSQPRALDAARDQEDPASAASFCVGDRHTHHEDRRCVGRQRKTVGRRAGALDEGGGRRSRPAPGRKERDQRPPQAHAHARREGPVPAPRADQPGQPAGFAQGLLPPLGAGGAAGRRADTGPAQDARLRAGEQVLEAPDRGVRGVPERPESPAVGHVHGRLFGAAAREYRAVHAAAGNAVAGPRRIPHAAERAPGGRAHKVAGTPARVGRADAKGVVQRRERHLRRVLLLATTQRKLGETRERRSGGNAREEAPLCRGSEGRGDSVHRLLPQDCASGGAEESALRLDVLRACQPHARRPPRQPVPISRNSPPDHAQPDKKPYARREAPPVRLGHSHGRAASVTARRLSIVVHIRVPAAAEPSASCCSDVGPLPARARDGALVRRGARARGGFKVATGRADARRSGSAGKATAEQRGLRLGRLRHRGGAQRLSVEQGRGRRQAVPIFAAVLTEERREKSLGTGEGAEKRVFGAVFREGTGCTSDVGLGRQRGDGSNEETGRRRRWRLAGFKK
mmetsp:Transcript_24781/g.62306  ORF Transcript_24781/g.62306 Transcript_24781/m.62306 type:complete len:526 (+) Transcript_24781:1710-3287(+)